MSRVISAEYVFIATRQELSVHNSHGIGLRRKHSINGFITSRIGLSQVLIHAATLMSLFVENVFRCSKILGRLPDSLQVTHVRKLIIN